MSYNMFLLLPITLIVVAAPLNMSLCLICIVVLLGRNTRRLTNLNLRFYFILLVYLGGVLLLILYICSTLPNSISKTKGLTPLFLLLLLLTPTQQSTPISFILINKFILTFVSPTGHTLLIIIITTLILILFIRIFLIERKGSLRSEI